MFWHSFCLQTKLYLFETIDIFFTVNGKSEHLFTREWVHWSCMFKWMNSIDDYSKTYWKYINAEATLTFRMQKYQLIANKSSMAMNGKVKQYIQSVQMILSWFITLNRNIFLKNRWKIPSDMKKESSLWFQLDVLTTYISVLLYWLFNVDAMQVYRTKLIFPWIQLICNESNPFDRYSSESFFWICSVSIIIHTHMS